MKGLEGNASAGSFTPWLLCSRYLKSRSIDQELEEAPVWHKVLAARALGMLFSFLKGCGTGCSIKASHFHTLNRMVNLM